MIGNINHIFQQFIYGNNTDSLPHSENIYQKMFIRAIFALLFVIPSLYTYIFCQSVLSTLGWSEIIIIIITINSPSALILPYKNNM